MKEFFLSFLFSIYLVFDSWFILFRKGIFIHFQVYFNFIQFQHVRNPSHNTFTWKVTQVECQISISYNFLSDFIFRIEKKTQDFQHCDFSRATWRFPFWVRIFALVTLKTVDQSSVPDNVVWNLTVYTLSLQDTNLVKVL